MLLYILKRIFESIPVLFAVLIFTFVFMKAAPGGPFSSEKTASPEVIKKLNERYNLDAPIVEQFFDYLKKVLQFDFGPSFKYVDRSVNEIIGAGLPVSLELGLYAIIFAMLLGISSGVFAAIRKNTWLDYLPMSFSMLGICVPSFLLGPALVLVFAIYFEIFPVSGWDDWTHKILPAITLGAGYAAYLARLSRAGMLDILNQDYIRTAKAKGVSNSKVILKHALKGGLLPVISFLGPAMAGLLAGSFVTETIFQIPGIGRFYVQGAFNRDYTLIMGTTILFSALLIFFNLLSDILLISLNPRLSFKGDKQ